MSEPVSLERAEDRRSVVSLRSGTAVTISIAFLIQCAYMVFALGRQAEKLDRVGIDVTEIRRDQYTAKDAQRDLSDLRREDEKFAVRMRDLEQALDRIRPPRGP
jgi:hypothetical protein